MTKSNSINYLTVFLAIFIGFFSFILGIYLLNDSLFSKNKISSDQYLWVGMGLLVICYGLWRIWRVYHLFKSVKDEA